MFVRRQSPRQDPNAARTWSARVAAVALVLLACRGAPPVGVRETGFEPVYASLRSNVLDSGEPSAWAWQVLAHLGVDERYRSEPDETLHDLLAVLEQERRRRGTVALAELHYHRGEETGERGHFLAAAILSYLYLFGDEFDDPPNPYDPRFRLACDLYNRGLARALREESGEVRLDAARFETPLGPVEVHAERPGFPWGEDAFERFLPADAFEIRGLRERIRDPGLGVPLIAVRIDRADPRDPYVARGVRLPATAFLRLAGGLDELRRGTLEATLELYLAVDVPAIDLDGRRVPLEADITAPLAHGLEVSRLWSFDIRGFMRGRTKEFRTGVFLEQPYQPGKIPVVFVHGTASSPATWAQMTNGLFADPSLRGRFQVWLAMYNTGNPIVYSAAVVREALLDLVAALDPDGEDEALRRMVLVGHSQGGLIARLLVSSSGDRLWRAIRDEPFEEADLGESRELLRETLFFEPVPFVQRAIFLSTPHGGSFLAASWVGRLANRFVEVPSNVATAVRDAGRGRTRLPRELTLETPTSVKAMDPDGLFVRSLARLPIGDGVRLHSIIAVNTDGPVEEGNDGVVSYASAHLADAESELVVTSGHSCQDHPEAIREVRRILLEHVKRDDAGEPSR